MTSPGIPDFYQGNELWDFSLVDPDNRHPVDYEKRARMLEKLRMESVVLRDPLVGLEAFETGAIKLFVTSTLLN